MRGGLTKGTVCMSFQHALEGLVLGSKYILDEHLGSGEFASVHAVT